MAQQAATPLQENKNETFTPIDIRLVFSSDGQKWDLRKEESEIIWNSLHPHGGEKHP